MKNTKLLSVFLLILINSYYSSTLGQEVISEPERVISPEKCLEIKDRFVEVKRAHNLTPSEYGYILVSPSDKQVLELDRNLTPLQSFGFEQRDQTSPQGLVKYPLHAASNASHVFVTDLFSQSVKLYSKQASFEKEIELNHRPRLSRFAVTKDLIGYTSDFPDCSIKLINSKGEIVQSLGKGYGDLRSIGHLFFLENKKLIRIGIINPTIELYNQKGELELESNLLKDPKIKEAWEWAKNRHYVDTTKYKSLTIPIVKDAFLHQDRIYLLIKELINHPVSGIHLNSKKIIVLEINDSLIQFKDQFYLSDKYSEDAYSAFCISENGNELLAFNYVSEELCLFDLK